MKFFIRFITLAAYFLPFCFFHTTCVGSDYRIAYNLQDAIINEAQADSIENISIDPIITDTVKNTSLVRDTTKWKKNSTLFDGPSKNNGLSSAGEEWQTYLVSPTKESLSAPGCIFFYKDIFGSIFIGTSAVITLFCLIFWKFVKRKHLFLFFDTINFFFYANFFDPQFYYKD